MASPQKSTAVKRAIAEAILGALLILSFPATLLFATQAIHGGIHGVSGTIGMGALSVLGVILLVDAWRLLRQQDQISTHPEDHTGGGTHMPR